MYRYQCYPQMPDGTLVLCFSLGVIVYWVTAAVVWNQRGGRKDLTVYHLGPPFQRIATAVLTSIHRRKRWKVHANSRVLPARKIPRRLCLPWANQAAEAFFLTLMIRLFYLSLHWTYEVWISVCRISFYSSTKYSGLFRRRGRVLENHACFKRLL